MDTKVVKKDGVTYITEEVEMMIVDVHVMDLRDYSETDLVLIVLSNEDYKDRIKTICMRLGYKALDMTVRDYQYSLSDII